MIRMSASEPVPDNEEEDLEKVVPEKNWCRQSGRRVPNIQDCFWLLIGHGSFHDMVTETALAANSGRRISAI